MQSSTQGLMLQKEFIINNKLGLHARPAAMFVKVSSRFEAEIWVEKDDEQVNGKSIMGLMMLAASKDSDVKFLATGDDAAEMLDELEQLDIARKVEEIRTITGIVEARPSRRNE